ncbi:MAG: hypothetical protein Q9217_005954 [Psora testacea]
MAFASDPCPGIKLARGYTFCVFVFPVGPLHSAHAVDALIVQDFDRAAPLGTGSAKIGGNYGPMLGIVDQAVRNGYGLTLHLDSKTHTSIDEFSTSAFVGVKVYGSSRTVVVSDSTQIVDSVTCASVCELALSFGWAVERRRILFSELGDFDEVFAAGTAAVLVPVRSIEQPSSGRNFSYRDGKKDMSSCYARLYHLLNSIQRGETEDPFGWTYLVTPPTNNSTCNGMEM